MEWSVEKITALAANIAAEQRGRALASLSKWQTVGMNDRAIWGECKGSGQAPYRVHIDLKELAFGCTCPTREHPCKHSLGLLFLNVQSPTVIAVSNSPEWVQIWLDKRDARHKKTESITTKTPENAAEKLKKQAQRDEQIEASLYVFEQWLLDAVQQGVAQLPVYEDAFWERVAAQLTDAKLPRLRQSVKTTAFYIKHKEEWIDYLLQRFGEWYGLIQAFRQRAKLSPAQAEDVYNALGRTIYKKDVLAEGQQERDEWVVVAQYEGENIDGIAFRQVWLYGLTSGYYAMLLDYKFGDAGYEYLFIVGSAFIGTIVFYPSNYPQRAVIEPFNLTESFHTDWQHGFNSFAECLEAYAKALAKNPFIEDFPAVFLAVIPIIDKGKFYLMDTTQQLIAVNPNFGDAFWQLMSASAGHPITIFVTFDGMVIDLYSVYNQYQWIALE